MPGIIVGVDGSGHSRRALEWAINEAAVRHTPLTVLTVHQAVRSLWTGAPVEYPGDGALLADACKAAQEETDAVLDDLTAQTPRPEVTIQAVGGQPAEALLGAAADADMIVVGSRGAGGFKKLLLGSVAAQVTHHARCPVVIVPAIES